MNKKRGIKHIIGHSIYHRFIKIKRWRANAKCKSISKDVNFSYLQAGSPTQETILLLHGFSDSKDGFLDMAVRLATKYHVLIPDLPGFGESGKPHEATYNLEQYKSWILDFLAESNVQKFHLAGHSLGGAIASVMASDHPDYVKSLTIINGGGLVPEHPIGLYQQWQEGRNIFEISNPEEFEEFFSLVFHKRPFIPGVVKHFLYNTYSSNKNWYGKIMGDLTSRKIGKQINHKMISKLAINEKLKDIKCPTLIIWGEKDRLFPLEIGHMFHKSITHSQMHIIQGGHCLNIEKPRELCNAYLNFLRGL